MIIPIRTATYDSLHTSIYPTNAELGQAAADEAVEWVIVELDSCDTDMLQAVAESYRYLTTHGFARGRK